MELRHLRYFAAVAETLNFTQAAENLCVAQPALSRQIRQLEEEIGVTLIDRHHSPVQLTDAGHIFHARIGKVLMQVDIAVTAAQEVARGHDGRLVICGDWWLGFGVVPESVADFRKRHPRIDLELCELPLYEQIRALHEGQINLGFLPRRHLATREDLESLVVVESEWMLLVSVDHPLARETTVRLVDLKKERFLWFENATVRTYRDAIVQLCRLARFSPLFGKRSTSRESMFALAASGYGIVLAPRSTLPLSHPSLRYVTTDCAPMELCAVWRRDDPSIPLKRFLETVRTHLKNTGTH
jgi:DNA-binding transcriptional LysR family regulator